MILYFKKILLPLMYKYERNTFSVSKHLSGTRWRCPFPPSCLPAARYAPDPCEFLVNYGYSYVTVFFVCFLKYCYSFIPFKQTFITSITRFEIIKVDYVRIVRIIVRVGTWLRVQCIHAMHRAELILCINYLARNLWQTLASGSVREW